MYQYQVALDLDLERGLRFLSDEFGFLGILRDSNGLTAEHYEAACQYETADSTRVREASGAVLFAHKDQFQPTRTRQSS